MNWTEFKAKHATGTRVVGKVTRRATYGFYVDVGDGFEGLVDILNFRDDVPIESEDEFPVEASRIEAVVLGFRDSPQQLLLGTRDSDFSY